jgi:DNA-binding MarR family transcriptional regulator
METKDKILKSLKQKKKTITELSDELGLSKSTVSQHLYELIDSGFIEEEPNDHFKKVKYFKLKSKERVKETQGINIQFVSIAIFIVALISIFAIVMMGSFNRGIQTHNITTKNLNLVTNNSVVSSNAACTMLPYYSTANYSSLNHVVLSNAEGNQCYLTYVNTKLHVIDIGKGINYTSYNGTLYTPALNYTYKLGPAQISNIENAAKDGDCWAYKAIKMFDLPYSGNETSCKSGIIN